MNKLTFLGLLAAAWALVCGDALAEPLSFNVPAGETNAYTSAIGSDVTAITKAGGGRLHLAQGTTQNAFAGTISIDEGTLGADTPPNFGKPTSVTVANGATLDLSAIAGNGSAGYVQNLTIAGYGYGDAGAFRRASGNAQDYLLKNLTLSGDAMFYNSVRCGASSGTIDLGGHTLEKRGGGEFLRVFYHGDRMTEIVQRLHGIHVEFHAKLAEIPGKFRIHPATFMCRHVKMRQTVYPLRVQCLCERQTILFKIQFMQLLSRFFHRGVASSRAPARRETPIMERTGGIVPHTSVQVNAHFPDACSPVGFTQKTITVSKFMTRPYHRISRNAVVTTSKRLPPQLLPRESLIASTYRHCRGMEWVRRGVLR